MSDEQFPPPSSYDGQADDMRIMRALREENAQLRRELSEVVAALPSEREWQRINFVRDAATRIYVQGMMVNDRAPGVVTFQPATCWRAASELWAAKPEDC